MERRRIRWDDCRRLWDGHQDGEARFARASPQNTESVPRDRSDVRRDCSEERQGGVAWRSLAPDQTLPRGGTPSLQPVSVPEENLRPTCGSLRRSVVSESRTPAGPTVPDIHSVQAGSEKSQARSSLGPSWHQESECSPRKRKAAVLYASAGRPKRRGTRGKASSSRWRSRWNSQQQQLQQERKRKRRRRGKPHAGRLDPPRPPKRSPTVLFPSRGGWGEVFNCIVALRDRSVLARHLADSLSSSFSQWQSRQRRIATSGGRARARRRRGVIRVLVRSYIEISLRWLQTGCLRLSETPVGRSMRLLASRAANEACCTAPLDFSGDKRGRLREVLASIVNRSPPSLNLDSLHFSGGPAQWSYDVSARRPEGALRIESARIALPDPACVVSLEDWLPTSIAEAFNSPATTDQPIAPKYFNVSMNQWRSVVRRMVRCKLAVALPSDTCSPLLSGGAFAVRKDAGRDRLICDRRPQNSQEAAVSRVLLPFCPRLRRLILDRSHALGVHIIDTRNCFYVYQVDPSRWHTQVIGPRIPVSWLHNLDDDALDEISDDDLETWWEPDLRHSPHADEPHDDFRQIAIVGVMMGDTNAVAVLEMAHRRQLINAGALRSETLLLPERPLPDGPDFGDVYIDDLVLFSILHFSRLCDLAGCPRAARAQGMYKQLAMPTSQSKKTASFRAEFWGGALDGIAGTLGFPMGRRTSLMYVTLLGAVLGFTRTTLQQLLGVWNFALSFRREALCCLGVAFVAARSLPTRKPIRASGALLNDLLLVCGLAPLLQADLRESPRLELFATDASPSGAGACVAPVSHSLWRTLYNLAEEHGEHVRLHWGSSAPPFVKVRLCCSRHSCRLVSALQLPVPSDGSYQLARAHGFDAHQTFGESGCQTAEDSLLC